MTETDLPIFKLCKMLLWAFHITLIAAVFNLIVPALKDAFPNGLSSTNELSIGANLVLALLFLAIPALAIQCLLLMQSPLKSTLVCVCCEIPILIFVFARMFVIESLAPSTTCLVVSILCGSLGSWIALTFNPKSNKSSVWLTLTLLSAGVTGAIWLSLILATYAPAGSIVWFTMVADVIRDSFSSSHSDMLHSITFISLVFTGGILACLVLPITLPIFYISILHTLAHNLIYFRALGVVFVVCIASLSAQAYFINQKDELIILELKRQMTGGGKTDLSDDEIKRGLVSAYLAPKQYVEARNSNGHVYKLYQRAFPNKDTLPLNAERWFDMIGIPILYHSSSLESARSNAKHFYLVFFQEEIEKAERKKIFNAERESLNLNLQLSF